ncbi:peptide/nickel transport system permease protein [Actinocorallia herbida]|uniref:Peptide/nickel transport system permease protein n=1 Tax=Actinocorallia herbida TaxID=58109 RepID=A0A3N1CQN0_9ACTN|nr:ABC transporter permease [Actinocorallia herbida]ROO83610.1 peptide/nickel transport system permease protein [Actinocorallia herbida]
MLFPLVRRAAVVLALAVAAASLGYLLAALSLEPRDRLEGRRPRPPQAAVEAELTALNLNDRMPLGERYLTWASGAVRGDFGRTLQGAEVSAALPGRLATSVVLLLPGTALGALAGVGLGAWAALARRPGRVFTAVSHVLLATPVFVIAIGLQVLGERLNAATGAPLVQWVGDGGGGLGAGLQHLVLPTLTVALAQLALFGRYQQALMRDAAESEHVRAARARGLGLYRAYFGHGLRTALVPTATYFAYGLGFLLLGAAYVETAFGRQGMGAWLLDSLRASDPHPVAACTAVAALAVPAAAFVADVAHRLLDPMASRQPEGAL